MTDGGAYDHVFADPEVAVFLKAAERPGDVARDGRFFCDNEREAHTNSFSMRKVFTGSSSVTSRTDSTNFAPWRIKRWGPLLEGA